MPCTTLASAATRWGTRSWRRPWPAPPGQWQDAPHGPDLPAQGELPDDAALREAIWREPLPPCQKGERQGQVEGGALFFEVGRGEVEGDAPGKGGEKAAVAHGGHHAVPRLLHRGVRQAYDADAELLGIGLMALDFHLDGVDAEEGGGVGADDHGGAGGRHRLGRSHRTARTNTAALPYPSPCLDSPAVSEERTALPGFAPRKKAQENS